MLLSPALVSANITVPFTATSTDWGFLAPNAVNGNFDGLLIGATTTIPNIKPQSGTLLYILENGLNARITSDTYANTVTGSIFQGRKARGTSVAPSTPLSGDTLALIGGDGYGTTGFHNVSLGAISVTASGGPFTDTSAATDIKFFTSATTTIAATQRMILDSNGNLGVGLTTPGFARLEVQGTTTDATANAFTAWNSAGASIFNVRNDGLLTFNNLLVQGSSTIGNGTASGGLTVSGTASTSNLIIPTLNTSGSGSITFVGPTQSNGNARQTISEVTSSGSNASQLLFNLTYDSSGGAQQTNTVRFQGANTAIEAININDTLGIRFAETFNAGFMGLTNTSGATIGRVPANGYTSFFSINNTGQLGSIFPTSVTNFPSFRNLLDDGNGRMGIGTTSPYALLSVMASSTGTGYTTLFAIGSSTATATTTLFSVDNTGAASTTKLFGAFLSSCNSASNALTWNAGQFGCNTISANSASSTLLSDSNTFSNKNMFLASTTIGNGTSQGGLNISGNATTTGTVKIGTNATSANYPLLTVGTALESSANDLAYFNSSSGLDAQLVLQNLSSGLGSYIKDVANSHFVSFELVGGNGDGGVTSDWKFGNFGNNNFNLFDGTNGKTPFVIEQNSPTNALYVKNNGNIGVGTSSPFAKLSVQEATADTNQAVFAVGSSTPTATSTIFAVERSGQQTTGVTTKPTLATCGTTNNVSGTDVAGTIQFTGTLVTACTLNFASPIPATENVQCQATTNSSSDFAFVSATSSTAVTFGTSASLSTGTIYYRCDNTIKN